MKKSVLFSLTFLIASTSFAGSTLGYLVEGSRGSTYYAGITIDRTDSAQLDMSSFSDAQEVQMLSCMDKRATHAIRVTTKLVEVEVPSNVRGRTTTFHDIKITGVDCVKAPGYITFWRGFWNH